MLLVQIAGTCDCSDTTIRSKTDFSPKSWSPHKQAVHITARQGRNYRHHARFSIPSEIGLHLPLGDSDFVFMKTDEKACGWGR